MTRKLQKEPQPGYTVESKEAEGDEDRVKEATGNHKILHTQEHAGKAQVGVGSETD